jgi:hypothetical protein
LMLYGVLQRTAGRRLDRGRSGVTSVYIVNHSDLWLVPQVVVN